MKRFGLIGKKLAHSLSPQIHSVYGDYEYKLFPLEPGELDGFFRERAFDGLNVTIPYKQTVIPYLSSLSPVAQRLNSVNTVTVDNNGSLHGDNTDFFGFVYTLERAGIDVSGKKVLVLGSGGSSHTVCAVCEDKGADRITVVSRSGSANYNNLHAYSDSEVIINTTPVGMYPSNGKSPIDLSAFPHCEAVCDLIYNPMKTALLLQAEKLGLLHTNGMSMLAAQAKYSSELFTGASLEHSLIEIAIDRANGIIRSIVLIGMPGCGKSSVGVALANRLGKVFLDTDDIVKINTDKTPAQLIRSEGENIFRDAESEAAIQAGKATGAVIATGGGIVLKESNMDALRQNALVVFIDRDLHRLATSDRPLSTGKNTLKKLWEQRLPLYKKYADIVIDGNASITEVAEKTLSALKTYT